MKIKDVKKFMESGRVLTLKIDTVECVKTDSEIHSVKVIGTHQKRLEQQIKFEKKTTCNYKIVETSCPELQSVTFQVSSNKSGIPIDSFIKKLANILKVNAETMQTMFLRRKLHLIIVDEKLVERYIAFTREDPKDELLWVVLTKEQFEIAYPSRKNETE